MVVKRHKIDIELFSEKTGEVIRVIHFKNQIEFEEFLVSFNDMRYPGYSWRHKDKVEYMRR